MTVVSGNRQGLHSEAPARPSRAILSQDHNPNRIPSGACSCRAAGVDSCVCPWGDLIREMILIGYSSPGWEAAFQLPALREQAAEVIAVQRRTLMQGLAAHWNGSVNDFLNFYSISRTTFDNLGLKIPRGNRK